MQADKLRDHFDNVFTQKTSYEVLNQTFKRIRKNKPELLQVLNYPDIPFHTNGSETDIRDYVKKEKLMVEQEVMKEGVVEIPLPV